MDINKNGLDRYITGNYGENQFKNYPEIPEDAHYPNEDDFDSGFWKHDYLVHLTAQDIIFAVNADNEQEAIDFIIDYCEEKLPGLIMSHEEESEKECIEDYTFGGNHGRYLNTFNIFIEKIY